MILKLREVVGLLSEERHTNRWHPTMRCLQTGSVLAAHTYSLLCQSTEISMMLSVSCVIGLLGREGHFQSLAFLDMMPADIVSAE